MRFFSYRFLPSLLVLTIGWAVIGWAVIGRAGENDAANRPPAVVDFTRDVRPILSDHCFACHGPDPNDRIAGLRLDTAEGIGRVVVSAGTDASALITRIESDDVDVMMPPPGHRKPLSQTQRDVLRSWVAAGAPVQSHWAFTRPTAGEIGIHASDAAATIDAYIDAAVAESGLSPNGSAPRSAILRRLCLDLTGLPPTREQIKAFDADDRADATERLVDRLLASPHFGQHVGRYWLDLVRYADTHGLHLDNYREMWPYRDWVIDAFNANMPFDRFVTTQIAGDLLPGATDADRIASGYNRLNPTTNEAGSIYQEVVARNGMDRTDAFGTVFLGLTMGCAACHDHKFDPISQQDYYSLLAFFDSLDGRALDSNVKDSPPSILVPNADQIEQLELLRQAIAQLQHEMDSPIETVDAAQSAWQSSLSGRFDMGYKPLHPSKVQSSTNRAWSLSDDGFIQVAGDTIAGEPIRVIADLPAGIQWQTLRWESNTMAAIQAAKPFADHDSRLSKTTIEIMDDALPGQWVGVPITYRFADVDRSGRRTASFIAPSLVAEGDGAKIRVTIHPRPTERGQAMDGFRLTIAQSVAAVPAARRITMGPIHTMGPFPIESAPAAYDRSFAGENASFDADEFVRYEGRDYTWHHRADFRAGEVLVMPVLNDMTSVTIWHQAINSPVKQEVTLILGIEDGYVVFLNGNEVARQTVPVRRGPRTAEYRLPLAEGENQLTIRIVNDDGVSQMRYAYRSPAVSIPKHVDQWIQTPTEDRSPQVTESLRRYFRYVDCQHPDWLALVDLQKGARVALSNLESVIPTTLVWKERERARKTYLLEGGRYDRPGEVAHRRTPAFLPELPSDAPENRLGLAMWLTSPDHPLTSRVAVNRFWQQIFGTGIVKTSEDFGSQGQPPSHPELLDWLAVDFQSHGWNVKRLIKSLVMTRAYQRSAIISEPMLNVDPENRLLARGPRHRLDAEVLRDQALSLAGLLVDRLGGPSVKPPQPPGLWESVGYTDSNTVRFVPDEGDDVYRRSVYLFWKRTSAPPQMSTLDAPSRESCTARRERTNTPLQALLLMNETQYIDAAKKLAGRAISEPELAVEDDAARAAWLFQIVTARVPQQDEIDEMTTLLTDMAVYYDENPDLADKLVGRLDSRLDSRPDSRLAAWTMLASTLLNLDETVSK